MHHWYGAAILSLIGSLLYSFFAIIALTEIYTSQRALVMGKIIWTAFFSFCLLLTIYETFSQIRFLMFFTLLLIIISRIAYLRFYRKKIIAPIHIEFDFDKQDA